MAPQRFRFFLVGFLIVLTLRLSHCQRRRACDCNAEGSTTYVCLLRCGRGSSGGSVLVLPVKKSNVPSPFRPMLEKFALDQDTSDQDIALLERYTAKPLPFPLEYLQSAMRGLRELSLTKSTEPRDSPYISNVA